MKRTKCLVCLTNRKAIMRKDDEDAVLYTSRDRRKDPEDVLLLSKRVSTVSASFFAQLVKPF